MKIFSQAPCRISLFGGGTDVGEYAQKYGGICINLAINIRQEFRIAEKSRETPYGKQVGFEFVEKIMKEMGDPDLVYDQTFGGEITGGLGSSASAAVALVGAINKHKDLGMSRAGIAERAWEIETGSLGLFGGKQDQYVATFGGINAMEFTNKVTIVPLANSFLDHILPGLFLFYTGSNRKSPKIQEGLRTITSHQKYELDRIKKTAVEAVPLIGT